MTWQDKAEAIYGHGWKSPLARLVNFNVSTILRWHQGKSPVRKEVVALLDDLYEVLEKHDFN